MQWVQSFLLRIIPASLLVGAFDFFHAYEPTPKYSSASAYLLLGFTWLWNGPAWRTAATGVRWRAWLHGLVVCTVTGLAGHLFFIVWKVEWTGLWLLLIGIVVIALGLEEPMVPVPVSPRTTADPVPPLLPTPAGPGRRSRTLVWWGGGAVTLVLLAGVGFFLAGGPMESSFKERVRARLGQPEDQLALGWRYREGRDEPQDYSKAADLFEQAAVQGLPRAQYDLAVLLYYGLGRPADEAAARQYLEQAVARNYPPALTLLGLIELREGNDVGHGFELLEKAANAGDARAGYLAGMGYCARRREKADYLARGLVWLERASQAGIAGAQKNAEMVWASVPTQELEPLAAKVSSQLGGTAP
jgi:hypothetical protein